MMNDLSFIQGWYDRGLKEKDIIFKFVSYFIAFNYLYRPSGQTTRDKFWMDEYVTSTVKAFYPNGSVFELIPPNSEYLDSTQIRPRGASFQEKTIENLFSGIYRVRCNLFHGSKTMNTTRSQSLVRDGATVLEDFLAKWLEKNCREVYG